MLIEESKPKRRNKIQNPYNMKHIYEDYLKSIGGVDSPYYVDIDEFKRMCTDYYKAMLHKLIYESITIKLPFRLGTLTIVKHKPKSFNQKTLTIDWAETKKYGKWRRYINDHTGGF